MVYKYDFLKMTAGLLGSVGMPCALSAIVGRSIQARVKPKVP